MTPIGNGPNRRPSEPLPIGRSKAHGPPAGPPLRTSFLPGPDFPARPVPVTLLPARRWYRVHAAEASPIVFRNLPHHRFSHPRNPVSTLYLAATIPTCLWEVFGDDLFLEGRAISAARWEGCALSEIQVPRLRCCSVSLAPTREAMGVDKATLMASDLAHPQAWSLAIQTHPVGFEAIQYTSRFVDQSCLAVFDRGETRETLQSRTIGALSDLDVAVEWLDQRNAALV